MNNVPTRLYTVDIGYSDSVEDREFWVKVSLYPISTVFLSENM